MYIRMIFVFLTVLFSSPIWSFPCYFTLAKDNCWTNYNVSLNIIDASTLEKITTIDVPAGQSWTSATFNCTTAQSLIYIAKFSPVFWKTDEGKTYEGLRNWSLPGTINPGDQGWTIPVCFPSDFSQVPLPPDAKGNCKCDFSKVPPPKTKKPS